MTSALGEFAFATAGRIVFGRGKVLEAPALITRFGNRVFLVHGRAPERAACRKPRHSMKASPVSFSAAELEAMLHAADSASLSRPAVGNL